MMDCGFAVPLHRKLAETFFPSLQSLRLSEATLARTLTTHTGCRQRPARVVQLTLTGFTLATLLI